MDVWRLLTRFDSHATAEALLGADSAHAVDVAAVVERTSIVVKGLLARLNPIIGLAAGRALLARSISLASAREPSLAHLTAGDDPSRFLLDRIGRLQLGSARPAAVHVLTTLVELLVKLIGEDLTSKLTSPPRPRARKESST